MTAGLSWGQEAACPSGEGGTDIRSGEDCVRRGPGRPWHRVRGEGLSLAWRPEGGSRPGTGQGSPLRSSGRASRRCARAWRDPRPDAGCAQGGGCQGERGRDSAAGLPPGCKHWEPVRQPCGGVWCPAWPWQGTLSRLRASGLGGWSDTWGCMCDVPGWPGESEYFAEQDCARRLCGSLVSAPPGPWAPPGDHGGAGCGARSELLSLPHSRTCLPQPGMGPSLPFFLPLLRCPAFSRGAEHGRLGVNVGSDRALVWGWAKEFLNLRLCHHWLQDRESLVSAHQKEMA